MPDSRSIILTKIIATIGPACADLQTLVRLIEEGIRVFRINFSHGSYDEFERSLSLARGASERAGEPVGVLGDLSGPKIRVGKVREGGIELAVGQRVEFQRQPIIAGEAVSDGAALFSTTLPQLIDDVQPGQRLFVNDGAIRMLVVDKAGSGEDRRLVCHVTHGGVVTSTKGINLPDTDIKSPSITEQDWKCADWAVDHGVDFLALSFVRRASDVEQLKRYLDDRQPAGGQSISVIAKIEKPQALDDLDAIVNVADGVMVARGDLGVEMDLAEVPVIQKRIIRMCQDYGKPVIVATQMLQSMIDKPFPTRAEASDVANAIFDCADAVMLSGETAIGRFPVQSVHTMARIAGAAESYLRNAPSLRGRPPRTLRVSRYRTAALAHGVSVVVQDLGAKAVITWSQRGGGARYLSHNRLSIPIIAASSDPASLRRMCLLYGVTPILMAKPDRPEQFIDEVDREVIERGWAEQGDAVVIVKGEPLGIPGVTNELRIHYVGEVCRVPQESTDPNPLSA
ncbi:MAG: pyruvate kinase [Phycisphaeraceae bacterium]